MKSSAFLTAAVAAGILVVSSRASAQDQIWLKDRRYTEGPGYRVGDFELHPGAAIEFGYDSNYLRRSTAAQQSLRLRITPSFSFSTLGAERKESAPSATPPSVIFRGGLNATYNEFIPIQSGSTVANNRNIGAAADLALVILPQRPWSGNVSAGVSRVLTASEDGATSSFNSGGTLNRDVVSASAEVGWAPGAGLFEWRLGYSFQGTFFEDSGFSSLNGYQNEIITRMRWRFLPRTSLVFQGRFGFGTFPNEGGDYAKYNSHPVRALLGVNGLVTPSFSVLAMVGWGASFYVTPTFTGNAPVNAPAQNFDSVVGQVEAKWFITQSTSTDAPAPSLFASSIAVGFLRDFYDSYIGSTYFERDRGYVALSYLYAGKFLLVVDGGVGPIAYPTLYPTVPVSAMVQQIPGFTDIRVDAGLFAEYRFREQFGVNLSFRYNQNFDPSGAGNKLPGPMNGPNQLAFQEIETYLGARWLM